MRVHWPLRYLPVAMGGCGALLLAAGLMVSSLGATSSSEPNAFLGLRLPLFNTRPAAETTLLNSAPAPIKMHAVRIPLLKERRHGLHVTMRLNNRVSVPFLVDTGATYTVISPRLAQQLGIVVPEDGPTLMLATANGLAKAPIVRIDRLAVDGYEMRNLQVVIRELGDSNLGFEGLLGLNFFQDVEFSVKRDRLELSVAG